MGDEAETELSPGVASSASAAIDHGRFVPGTILDARYRIVSLLGRGGMGEVYRAEDLKLGETVALKFLPEALGADGAALARLHREVRTARGIAHPNVVRVYDIGEQDGQPFLSMEYVDGEDLAALLRRIGHLSDTKGVELARQICAGLAAAHQAGVLHRDLKPANVMIDGDGRAKINDFGLSDLAADLEAPDTSGTPQYMAPEQLTEGRSSFASDVYALGLVLYEMFTGRRPYEAASAGELITQQRETEPTSPTSHVTTLDPLIERAVMSCLARDPADRPTSPLDVAARLPGGDPVAAALAAGETPSPEMVARAAVPGVLRRPVAWALLIITLVGTLAVAALSGRVSMFTLDGVPLKPEVLDHTASELLAEVGWKSDREGVGYFVPGDYFLIEQAEDRHTREEWEQLAEQRPGFLHYWFRVGTDGIAPTGRWRSGVWLDDPPVETLGTATVQLDSRGRLRSLLTVPIGRDLGPSAGDPDWQPLFAAADLDMADFASIEPWRAPPIYADRLAAWEGVYPGEGGRSVRVLGAARGDRIVAWSLTEEALIDEGEPAEQAPLWLALLVLGLMWLVGGWQAVRNLHSGRGDRRGATRVALATGGAMLVTGLMHVSDMTTNPPLSLLFLQLAEAAFIGLVAWLVYLALEPLLRRHFPKGLVAWSRLLAGRFTDPLVGRDLLLGMAIWVSHLAIAYAVNYGQLQSSGGPLQSYYPHGFNALAGPLPTLANVFSIPQVVVPLALVFLYVIPSLVVPWPKVARGVGALTVFAFCFVWQGASLAAAVWGAVVVVLVVRIGLVGMVAMAILMNNLSLTPVSLDPASWWAPISWINVAVVLAVATAAFRLAAEPKSA